MNQKKAKALRRECIGMPKMIQRMPLGPIFKTFRHRKTGEIKRVRVNPETHDTVVNHYHNAKVLYRGSIKRAVRAAIRHADLMEACGRYTFPKRTIF